MFKRLRSGLTAVEMILTFGILSMAAGLIIPSYRDYLIRNDLELARQRVAQGIERAKFLSQVGMNDSSWGFKIDTDEHDYEYRGVIFMGDSWNDRNPGYDEYYPIPETIVPISGPVEVVFEKISGAPSTTETIILQTTLTGDVREINISVGEEGNVSIPEEWLEICVDPYTEDARTIKVPDALWEYYEEQGAIFGSCGTSVGGASSASSVSSSSAGSSATGGVPIEEECDPITDPDDPAWDTITPTENLTCTSVILGAAIESSGQPMPVTFDFKVEDLNWEAPFGSFIDPIGSDLNDGETHSFDCHSPVNGYNAGSSIFAKARSWKWQSGQWKNSMTVDTSVSAGNCSQAANCPDNVIILRDGDPVPEYTGLNGQADVQDFLQEYIDASDPNNLVIDIGVSQYIYLFELGTTNENSSAFDMQDLVVLITVEGAL